MMANLYSMGTLGLCESLENFIFFGGKTRIPGNKKVHTHRLIEPESGNTSIRLAGKEFEVIQTQGLGEEVECEHCLLNAFSHF